MCCAKLPSIRGLYEIRSCSKPDFTLFTRRIRLLRSFQHIEKDFHRTSPEVVRSIGQNLEEFLSEKEIEDESYSGIMQIIYKWAHWAGEVKTDEQ